MEPLLVFFRRAPVFSSFSSQLLVGQSSCLSRVISAIFDSFLSPSAYPKHQKLLASYPIRPSPKYFLHSSPYPVTQWTLPSDDSSGLTFDSPPSVHLIPTPVNGHITLKWTLPWKNKTQRAPERKVRVSSLVPPSPSRPFLQCSLESSWLTIPEGSPPPWAHLSWSLWRHSFFPPHG